MAAQRTRTKRRTDRIKPFGRRPWWVTVAAVAAALPLVGLTPTASYALSRTWSGNLWPGLVATGPETSLDVVRGAIHATTGPAASLSGAGVGIALVDTGVAAVPGLPAAQVVNGPDLSFESQSDGLRYLDTYGHGTHLAGIMVANDPATGTTGIASQARLTSVKVGTAGGAVDVSQVIAAVDWVVEHRADDPASPIRVLNLAYGTAGAPASWSDPLQYAVEQAWRAGIVVVAAGGNLGGAAARLTNPAVDDYVVAVGAAKTTGASSSFNISDASRPLDVLAPGESIVSLRVPGSSIDTSYPTARVGGTLFRGSGTSQAAAVSSAAAALLLQHRPGATPDQVKAALRDGGRLDVNNAIAKLDGALTAAQDWTSSTGKGPLELARGTSHVLHNGATLRGERTVWGSWNGASWAARSAAHNAWSGGSWLGTTVAGDGWTGASWASRTWAPARWAATPWGGGAWTDGRFAASDDWSSRTWA